MSMSYFHNLKIWLSELPLALVSCQYINASLFGSQLKKGTQQLRGIRPNRYFHSSLAFFGCAHYQKV